MIPPITTIVVNWNRAALLSRCLASLRAQTVACETIVVDNGSRDGSVEMVAARFPEVRVVRLPENRGFTGGNNVGLQYATTPFVFLLNNDTELEPDCLERLATCLVEAPADVAGVFPKVLFDDDRHLVNAFGAVWHHRVHWLDVRVGQIDGAQFRSRERIFGSILAAVLLRRAALDDVGAFDEAFLSYGEDFDLCYRANILGWSFLAEPAAIVYHRHRGSAQVEVDPLWHHFLYVRNYLLVFLKNYSTGNLVRHFPWAFYRYYVAGLRAAVRRRNRREVALFARVLRSLVGLLPHVLRERRRLQPRRKVADRDVWSFAPVEDFNLFCPDGNYVLSRLNLLLGSEGASRRYEVEGREYVVPDGRAVRVLVVTNDRVAAKRAGPAIRSYEIARVLAGSCAVTLAAAIAIEEAPPGVATVSYDGDGARLKSLADAADVVVLAPFILGVHPELLATDAALVADLTDPYVFEQLALAAHLAGRRDTGGAGDVAGALRALRFELDACDLVLCASERQRMLYLGMLSALGRLTAQWYAHDPTLERLVAIVPFGSSDQPFEHRATDAASLPAALGGRRVLLWGGGVWNWLDPLTPIRAAARLQATHPDATLVFLGRGHPHPALPAVHFETARAAEDYATAHLLAGRAVVFGEQWVAFDARRAYLAHAEIGVSAHPDSAETRFAFRTRLLDYFWAGLPIVTTAGDVLADLVHARGAGVVVPCGDDAAMAAAFAALLDDGDARRRAGAASAAIARELRWEVVIRPLAEFIARVGRGDALLTGAHGTRRTVGDPAAPSSATAGPSRARRTWFPWARAR